MYVYIYIYLHLDLSVSWNLCAEGGSVGQQTCVLCGGLEIEKYWDKILRLPSCTFSSMIGVDWGDNPFKAAKFMPIGEVVAFPPCEVIKPLFDDIHHQLAPQSDRKDKWQMFAFSLKAWTTPFAHFILKDGQGNEAWLSTLVEWIVKTSRTIPDQYQAVCHIVQSSAGWKRRHSRIHRPSQTCKDVCGFVLKGLTARSGSTDVADAREIVTG